MSYWTGKAGMVNHVIRLLPKTDGEVRFPLICTRLIATRNTMICDEKHRSSIYVGFFFYIRTHKLWLLNI